MDDTGHNAALPGEDQGLGDAFSIEQLAAAFGVAIDRVRAAVDGEFGGSADVDGEFGGSADVDVDSRQAQHLADVVLGDRPQAEREAALMALGAYTPRYDAAEATAEEKPDGEQSDKMRRFDDEADGNPSSDGR